MSITRVAEINQFKIYLLFFGKNSFIVASVSRSYVDDPMWQLSFLAFLFAGRKHFTTSTKITRSENLKVK